MRHGRAQRGERLALIGVGSLALALLLGLGASARPRHEPPMPGPTARERSDDRIAQNDDCVTCHDAIAAEWAGSLHARSFVDPMFQASIQRERSPEFCRSCHAPEADPRREPEARRAQLGVSCVGCHLVGDEILAGPGDGGLERAPHPVRRELAFASSAACAGCHEFAFPKQGSEAVALMQSTIREHARSPAHQTPCQDCHMPPRSEGGRVHRGHGFAVASEPKMLRAAARITAQREQARVRVTLEPRAAGHAFPTGDLFRRLLVRVETQAGETVGERYLARHFGAARAGQSGAVKVELSDDRVGVGLGPRVVEFEVPATLADEPLRWTVRYQRVLETPVGAEHQAKLWDETELAVGVLQPAPREN